MMGLFLKERGGGALLCACFYSTSLILFRTDNGPKTRNGCVQTEIDENAIIKSRVFLDIDRGPLHPCCSGTEHF